MFMGSLHPDVMHRDLKLENILIGENPSNPDDHLHIKVTDFGLAILREGLDDMANNFCGTPAYMGQLNYTPSILCMRVCRAGDRGHTRF